MLRVLLLCYTLISLKCEIRQVISVESIYAVTKTGGKAYHQSLPALTMSHTPQDLRFIFFTKRTKRSPNFGGYS